MFSTVPNALTALRAVLALPILGLLLSHPPQYLPALALFALAALTDLADGICARYLNQRTALGARLDPVADKVLVAAPLAAMLATGQFGPIATGAALIVLAREILVLVLRVARARRGAHIAASGQAKAKTFLQMAGTALLLAASAFPGAGVLALSGAAVLAAAAVVSVTSAIAYLRPERP